MSTKIYMAETAGKLYMSQEEALQAPLKAVFVGYLHEGRTLQYEDNLLPYPDEVPEGYYLRHGTVPSSSWYNDETEYYGEKIGFAHPNPDFSLQIKLEDMTVIPNLMYWDEEKWAPVTWEDISTWQDGAKYYTDWNVVIGIDYGDDPKPIPKGF